MKKILSIIFLSKRAKSFYWRAGFGVGLLFTAHLMDVLPSLQLPEIVAVVVSYVLNEVTKLLNTKSKEYGN